MLPLRRRTAPPRSTGVQPCCGARRCFAPYSTAVLSRAGFGNATARAAAPFGWVAAAAFAFEYYGVYGDYGTLALLAPRLHPSAWS